ncbi:MAG: T9SS type A sorting domain-containing protein [Candidatus Krumholzibacteriota bacterium]|nr:T9SS type A sorting domain-containing protein [Candidatus Krumholzibacteriota bacterium]
MKKTGIIVIMSAVALLAASSVFGQYGVLHSTFVSTGGQVEGSHRLYHTSGQGIIGVSADGSNMIRSGFWHQAFITSTVEVTISSFDCVLSGYSVLLNWELSLSGGPAEINIFRSDDPGGPFDRVNETAISAGFRSSYLDETVTPGRRFYYRLEVIEGEKEYTSVLVSIAVPPRASVLFQNYPNPFNPETTIRYYKAESGPTKLSVYDVRGQLIAVAADRVEDPGMHSAMWDGKDRGGDPVGSGVYYYRLVSGKKVFTKKMVLLR